MPGCQLQAAADGVRWHSKLVKHTTENIMRLSTRELQGLHGPT